MSATPTKPELDAFRDLALELRASGAVKVRSGELEVVWATAVPQAAVKHPEPKPRQTPEQERLAHYQAELEGTWRP